MSRFYKPIHQWNLCHILPLKCSPFLHEILDSPYLPVLPTFINMNAGPGKLYVPRTIGGDGRVTLDPACLNGDIAFLIRIGADLWIANGAVRSVTH